MRLMTFDFTTDDSYEVKRQELYSRQVVSRKSRRVFEAP